MARRSKMTACPRCGAMLRETISKRVSHEQWSSRPYLNMEESVKKKRMMKRERAYWKLTDLVKRKKFKKRSERTRKIEEVGEINECLLPDELVIAVLSTLPVKSLFRFKCVSKRWCLVIGDGYFSEAHRSNNRTAGVIFLSTDRHDGHKFISEVGYYYSPLRPEQEGPEKFVPRLDLLFSPLSGCKGVTNIVKGLSCFYGHHFGRGLSIANITTGEIKDLPVYDPQTAALITRYHLGFDPVHKVYKLLRVRLFFRSDDNSELYSTSLWSFFHNYSDVRSNSEHFVYFPRSFRIVCEILTIGLDSRWRKLHDDIPVYLNHTKSIHVNGFTYWRYCRCYGDGCPNDYNCDKWAMVSFDFDKEVFRFIRIPASVRGGLSPKTNEMVIQFEGKMAIAGACTDNPEWLMVYSLEDEVGLLWSKGYFSISRETLDYADAAAYIVSIGNLPSGKLLLVDSRHRGLSTPVHALCARRKYKRFILGSIPPLIGSLSNREAFNQMSSIEETFAPLDVLLGTRCN